MGVEPGVRVEAGTVTPTEAAATAEVVRQKAAQLGINPDGAATINQALGLAEYDRMVRVKDQGKYKITLVKYVPGSNIRDHDLSEAGPSRKGKRITKHEK